MDNFWGIILGTYVVGAILWLVGAAVAYSSSSYSWERRISARAVLATPAWPLGVMYFLYLGIRAVVKDAFDR